MNKLEKKKSIFAFAFEKDGFFETNLLGPIERNFNNTNIINLHELFRESPSCYTKTEKLKTLIKENPSSNLIIGITSFAENFIPEELYKEASNHDVKLIGYLGDSEYYFDLFHRYYMYFLCGNILEERYFIKEFQLQTNELINVLYLQQSCNFDIFRPLKRTKEFDMVFIGRPFSNRHQIMRALLKAGIKLKIFGSRQWLKYADLKEHYGGFLDQKTLVEVLNKSKLVLTLCTIEGTQDWQVKGRLFEFLGCKICQITNFDERLSNYFTLEKDIITFKSIPELVQKTKNLLQDDTKRNKIAENAYQHAKEKYDYDVHFKGFAEFIDNCTYQNSKPPHHFKLCFHNISEAEMKERAKEYKLSNYLFINSKGEIIHHSASEQKTIDITQCKELTKNTPIVFMSGHVEMSNRALNTYIDTQIYNIKKGLPYIQYRIYTYEKDAILAPSFHQHFANLNCACIGKVEDWNVIRNKIRNKSYYLKLNTPSLYTKFPLIKIRPSFFGKGLRALIDKWHFASYNYANHRTWYRFLVRACFYFLLTKINRIDSNK